MGLTSIAIDSQAATTPAQWSAEWVMRRVAEAYATERLLPLARRSMIANAWPHTVTEFADVVGRADDDRRERFAAWEYAALNVSAKDITRQEEAHDWLLIILAPYPEERLCLAQWAAAKAYRRSLRRMLLKRGWSRSTFLRRVAAGAHVIAVELTRQGIPVA